MQSRKSNIKTGDDTRPAWLLQNNVTGRWLRLRAHNEEALTTAWSDPTGGKVALDGGRTEARLWPRAAESGTPHNWAGEVVSRYAEDSPATLLACSRWCFKPRGDGGRWTPFAPDDDQNLEAGLQEMLRQAQISPGLERLLNEQQRGAAPVQAPDTGSGVGSTLALAAAAAASAAAAATSSSSASSSMALSTGAGRYQVRLSRDGKGGVQAEMSATPASWSASHVASHFLGSTSCLLSRGWAGAALPPLSEDALRAERSPPRALVLVVHGIGETLWRRGENIAGIKSIDESVERLRLLADKAAIEAVASAGNDSTSGSDEPLAVPRAEFLTVCWDTDVRADDEAREAVRRLRRITLPSIPTVRQFANEVIADVLLYEQPRHRTHIQRRVVERINGLYHAWLAHNPGWSGPVVLCGHSLGSLISFDVLQQAALSTAANGPARVGDAVPPGTPERLACRVSALLALGSPLGYFLAMRGTPLGPSFTLQPACDRLFNLFAKNDPIAYRLEPLLLAEAGSQSESDGEAYSDGDDGDGGDDGDDDGDCEGEEEGEDREDGGIGKSHDESGKAHARGTGGDGGKREEVPAKARSPIEYTAAMGSLTPRTLPPQYVPFAANKRGTRLHIKVRQELQQASKAAAAARDSVQRALNNPFATAANAVKGMASTVQGLGWRRGGGDGQSASQTSGQSVEDPARFAINSGGERVDWQLQESEFEHLQEYWAALQAHASYFYSEDVASFIVNDVIAPVLLCDPDGRGEYTGTPDPEGEAVRPRPPAHVS
jgi:hypothetical protein